MLDLILRGARLPDRSDPVDIAVADGTIADIAPRIDGAAAREIEATGRLVGPPFADPHFHMDATLSLGLPRMNVSGTLLEGIALWGELKPLLTPEAVAERALKYCDLAVAQGLLAIRSHVDVCDDRLTAVEALTEVRKQVAPYIDLQLVAFPQDGLFRAPNAEANLLRALDMGVDVVGGIPHFERTMDDGAASVKRLCEIAVERGLPVDLHCDETDDPMSRHVETLAAETTRLGLGGRVVASHVTSMHSIDNYYASKLIPLIAESGMHIVPNPRVTVNSFAVMGLPDPTLRIGGPADMVVLQARDPIEAVRLKATRLFVIRRGKVISETPPRRALLTLDGRPTSIDPADYAPSDELDNDNRMNKHAKGHEIIMKMTRRGVLVGAAATLALPAYIRRAHAAPLSVAAVHASPVENAWNSRIHLAFLEARDAGLVDYTFSEGVASTDYPRAMREFADGGTQLVWGESYAVEREAREVASDYPDTAFLMGSSGGPQGDNFGVFGTRNHEAAYLAGMLSGTMSETGTFGSVGGYPIPEVNLLINAFRMGVSRVNPDATFLNGFIGAWFDPAKAKELAVAQADAGADVLFGERIGTADGAQETGVKAIGSLIDYTPRYPGTVFANAIWNYGPTVEAIVADVTEGNPVGKDYTEFSFMKHGGNELIYVADEVPAEAVGPMEEVRAAIESGEFEVPIDAEEPK